MRIAFFFLIGILYSCNGEGNHEEVSAIDSSYCDCSELVFDEPYNHFWRFEKRKGFTGTCEEFYSNGVMKTHKQFIEGKLHGKMFTYFDDGKLKEEKEFDMNLQTGEQITYSRSGEVGFHALYKRGKQTQVLLSNPEVLKEDPWPGSN